MKPYVVVVFSLAIALAQGVLAAPPPPSRMPSLSQKALAQPEPTWTIALYLPENEPQSESPTTGGLIYEIPLYGALAEVPSVKGKTWDEAQQVLAEANLSATKINEKATGDDRVNRQDIEPGKKVAVGTEVRLDLIATVPNIVGMTIGEAYEELEVQSDFRMKYDSNWSSDYVVTHQKPKAGDALRRGRNVYADCMVEVPNVTNISVEEAKERLSEAKLLAKLPDYFEDTDRVLRQKVRSGKSVLAHSKVGLTPGVEVPNLVGLEPRVADNVLRPTGIRATVRQQNVFTENALLAGRAGIAFQSISPGRYVARDSRFSVTIRRYVYQRRAVVQPVPVGGGNSGGDYGGGEGGGAPAGGGG